MKIWLIHHYAIPPTEAGVTRHYQLAFELKKRGHLPTIITADIHHRTKGQFRLPGSSAWKLDTSNPVPILRLRALSASSSTALRVANMLAFAFRIFRRTGLENLEKPDLIIGCTPDLFSAFVACRLAKKLNVPFVFHVGELWPLMLTELGNVPRWHPFVLLLGLLEKYLYRHAAAVVAAQPLACDHIKSRGGSRGEVFYVPNGVDLDRLPPLQPVKPDGGEFKIMYIGAMGLANGMSEILDSARLVLQSRIRFFLMGDGPLRSHLMRKAEEEKLSNVVFLEPVPKKDVYLNMSDVDAFIVNIPAKKPYEYGLAHNKVFDYMAMARPTIIATNTADNPITEYDAGILIPSNDSRGMAEAIMQLAAMTQEKRDDMGLRGRAGIEKKYNFSHLGEIFEAALAKTIASYRT